MKKIDSIGLGKLNNAEYTNFAERTAQLVQTATPVALGLTQAQYEAYAKNIKLMTDIVAQSRISDETADIAQLDKECDDLIVYFNATIKTTMKSPLTDQRTAATHLYNVTKPYIGIQNLAQGQQIQQTRGLLTDLGKEENTDAIDTLGLGPVIQQLRQKNNQYANLVNTRSAAQAASKLDAGKTVRLEMDVQYDEIVTLAFVTSISAPTAVTDTFVTNMNKLIADTNAAYNQRVGLREANKKKKNEETPETPES